MKHYYNEHGIYLLVNVPALTTPSAPVTADLVVPAAQVLAVTIWQETVAAAFEVGFRLKDENFLIIPQSGYINLPLTVEPLTLQVGYKLAGPGWKIRVELVNSSGATARNIGVFVHLGDVHEMDVSLQILEVLQEMNKPEALKRVINTPVGNYPTRGGNL